MFEITASHERAGRLLGQRRSARRRRSDAGRSRLDRRALRALEALAGGDERPSMAALQREHAARCARLGVRAPARATLYNTLVRLKGHAYAVSDLPVAVRRALYNVASDAVVPGRQLAFFCFNYGSLPAISFAAGLPWLDLYQATRLRGWRPRSRGLLLAARRARGTR
jgi:hypothetical protein